MSLGRQPAFSFSGPRVGSSRWRRTLGVIDWPLILGVLMLCAVGLANLYSATADTAHSRKFSQQIIWMSFGVGIFSVMTAIDYRSFHKVAWAALICAIVAIVFVRIFSDPIKGSNRWLAFGSIRLQPSEFAKIAVILAVARILHDSEEGEISPRHLLVGGLGILFVILLVAWQPDLGSASLLALIALSMALLLTRYVLPLFGALALGVASLPMLWDRMEPYQQSRVLAFLDRTADPTGAAWQTEQSINAVGSGQLTGKGYLNATQNHFNFLPEHWTDFPFSVWAEEWGFLGAIVLLAVFLLLILWVINIGLKARDVYGQAVCIGVAAMIFWHTLVNLLMVLGLAPVVGVTLPLISYGGSSVLTFFLGLGLVSSVAYRGRKV